MKIIAEADFKKVVRYELSFVRTQLVDSVALAKRQIDRATNALEFHDQLVETLGNGLASHEWRLGMSEGIKKHTVLGIK